MKRHGWVSTWHKRRSFVSGAAACFLVLWALLWTACSVGGSGGSTTTYTISGTISGSAVEGVTVTLSGTSSSSATTSSSGTYSFTVKAGTYTVKPSLYGYTFSPTSTSVTVAKANVSGVDFTSSAAATYTLSGTVTGTVVEGVTMTLSGSASAAATTDSAGDYSFTVSAGTFTVTPSLSGYSFTPSSSSATVSSADVSGVDFTCSVSTLGDRTDYSSVSLTSGGTYSSSDSGVEKQYYSYTSTTSDTPAVKVGPGGSLTLNNSKAVKSGGATSNTENSGFYGFNSGVLASSSSSTSSYTSSSAASVTMTDCTITTGVTGANGVFAFGADATATLDHVTITTTGDSNSRGVDATYGGKVVITNSVISTQGGSCAALATDRYQGTSAPSVTATNCTGATAGTGSPGIYCTGTFNVTDCTLTATGSEAACIEGLNSITLTDTSLSGAKKWGVIIYQSTSGDSSEGTGNFTMTGGTLTNNFSTGPLFFVCDTSADIALSGATLENASSMLLVAGKASTASNYISNVNSDWGSLGGTVTFTASNETMTGSIIICDSSSSIDLTLTGSTLTGAIDGYDKGTADKLTLDSSSKWTADGDSYVETLAGVVFSSGIPTNIDAASGVTIHYTSGTDSGGTSFSGTYTLASGGTLTKS